MKQKRPRSVSRDRLLIAVDVISQVLSGALSPFKGRLFGDKIESEFARSSNLDGQTVLCDLVQPDAGCQVCAKGALIVAHTMRFNKLSVAELDIDFNRNTMAHELPEFPKKMMAEIETLFEGTAFSWNQGILTTNQIGRLLDYISDNILLGLPASERLIHIMGLLIKNNGKKILL